MRTSRRGYALATVLILLGVCLFGVGALVTSSVLESKISRSQAASIDAYYVAEAGVHDAVWRLNTDMVYNNALGNGTLNVSYSTTNIPSNGQGYSVLMQSVPGQPNYGTLEVTGTSNNGSFTSKRVVKARVFRGAAQSPIGRSAVFFGGALNITNGQANFIVPDGDIFSLGDITINQATVNVPNGGIYTPYMYRTSSSTVNTLTISASNVPPAPAPPYPVPPAFPFTALRSTANAVYTPAQFESLVRNAEATIDFPGPVTYIDGNINLGNWIRDKSITISGMLVVNGTFSMSSSAGSSAQITINDPGTGKSGIFVNGSVQINDGQWVINGVMYSTQNITLLNPNPMTIDGALIGVQSATINTGLTLSTTYNANRVTYSFDEVTLRAVSVDYWEEEY